MGPSKRKRNRHRSRPPQADPNSVNSTESGAVVPAGPVVPTESKGSDHWKDLGRWERWRFVFEATVTTSALLAAGLVYFQLRDSHQALLVSQRPWLIYKGINGKDETKPYELIVDRPTHLVAKLINSGTSPALEVSTCVTMIVGKRQATPEDKCMALARPAIGVVGPGQEHLVGLDLGPFDESHALEIEDGSELASVIVGADYTDQFGQRHTARFCALLVPGAGFVDCEGFKGKID